MKIKILLLILINVCLLTVFFYFLEFSGVINYYSNIKNQLVEVIYKDIEIKQEDPNLIEKEEYKKLLTSIDMREADLKKYETELKDLKKKLDTDTKQLKDDQVQLQHQRDKIKKDQQRKADYSLKVKELAQSYMNMPPEKSVERLVELDDDLLILDILKEIDLLSEENGQDSIKPYLFSLMDKSTAARLMRKSTITP